MENKIVVTKEKIKKYLKNYIYLTKIIKARELKWILGRGPSLKEWQERINTVEIQAINKEPTQIIEKKIEISWCFY